MEKVKKTWIDELNEATPAMLKKIRGDSKDDYPRKEMPNVWQDSIPLFEAMMAIKRGANYHNVTEEVFLEMVKHKMNSDG